MEQIEQGIQLASAKPIIEFRGVSKTYQTGTHALEDVNIKINSGEFVFVVGSSGAGKSTFMKLIMREEKASTGKIVVNGFNLTRMKRKTVPILRRTMGIVFQDYQLLDDRNAFYNLYDVMKATGWKNESDIRRRIDEVLKLVKLDNKAYKMPCDDRKRRY